MAWESVHVSVRFLGMLALPFTKEAMIIHGPQAHNITGAILGYHLQCGHIFPGWKGQNEKSGCKDMTLRYPPTPWRQIQKNIKTLGYTNWVSHPSICTTPQTSRRDKVFHGEPIPIELQESSSYSLCVASLRWITWNWLETHHFESQWPNLCSNWVFLQKKLPFKWHVQNPSRVWSYEEKVINRIVRNTKWDSQKNQRSIIWINRHSITNF